ncbi:MAG: acetyl-CoA carboxylase biotin carboxyl carrier protein subunit [Myxococcota bacterium]
MAEEIRAHITGTVWKIEVEVGEEVEEEDDLVILESMKMEMPVECPRDDVVKEIKVAEGDAVEEDQVLVVLE